MRKESMYPHKLLSGIEGYGKAVNPARLEILRLNDGPLAFSKAFGSWLEDPFGRRFLDLICGYGAATLGHRHPDVIAALQDALSITLPFTYPSSVSTAAGDLGSKLCELAGRSLSKVYFGNSGAEGIEAALKFAMARTGRTKFLSFSEAFHGLTLGALSLAGNEQFRKPFPALGVSARQVPFEDIDYLEHCLKTEPIAGVVVEPVQGMAGARRWKKEKLEELSSVCHRHGAVLILDEVLTGIGRTGNWFAFQDAGDEFAPDIVVVSKGLSAGVMPICAVLMTDDVYESVYSGAGRANIHASTFEGNLMAMAAGLTVIRIIERDHLLDRVRTLAERFEHYLTEIRKEEIGITDVRVFGLLIGFQVADDLFKDEPLWGAAGCRSHLLSRAVLTNLAAHAPTYINLTPAFTLSDSDLEWFFAQLRAVVLEGS
jgi:ornithine--oxo-acid transaminase